MKRWDKIASVLGVAYGVLLVISSLSRDLGELNHPGPGFMPLGAGVLFIVLCVAYGVQSIRSKDDNYAKRESPWPKENWGRLISVIVALLVFAVLMRTLGYLLSAFVFMIFAFRAVETERWYITLIKASLSVLSTYIIFDKWLMIQFPKGFLGM
ncbi:MAG: tripartite tricarboxylate transporter TctB family protein [Candidatus Hodarchaeota archaeon]